MDRRKVLIGAGAAGAVAAVSGLGWVGASVLSEPAPLALVYRGPASCPGCSEAVAALLRGTPTGFRTEFCGPGEQRQVSASTLAEAAVYAQPGGGQVYLAWPSLRDHTQDIREFVQAGGTYLGFCLGAYLADRDPGFGLLPGRVDSYIATRGASVRDEEEAVVAVRWRGQPRHMYFQDGSVFRLASGAPVSVLATYDTGAAAAVTADFGEGRIGLVGPHPEAEESWYVDAGLTNPDGVRFDLGHDLVESTLRRQPS